MKKSISLTPDQFAYIITECDAVLAKYPADIFINGNAWLQVLHSHPSIQDRYVNVFYPENAAVVFRNICRRTAVLASDLFLSLGGLLASKADYQKLSPKTSVLFISHLLNTDTSVGQPDFYFQELPQHLQQAGHQVAIGLMNHVKGFSGGRRKHIFSADQPHIFLLPQRLGFRDELKLLLRSLAKTLLFFKAYLQEKDSLKKSFLFELTASTLSPHTLRALRLYKMIQYLSVHTGIRVVALTWEGHSWEKMVCCAAKTAGREITCLGYQHTILFPSSYALKKAQSPFFAPAIILTVGSITKSILERSADLNGVKIVAYGSPRLKAGDVSVLHTQLQNACLVAPEGLVNECLILFPFAVTVARLLPDVQFIFRTHPSIRFADLVSLDSRLQQLPANVTISAHKNINDDFAVSSWLLYRNSSVSFFAIQAGLRPVYVSVAGEISNDVLYELKSWRLIISDPAEMTGIILQDRQSTDNSRSAERTEALAYSKAYMQPYQLTVFDECMVDVLN